MPIIGIALTSMKGTRNPSNLTGEIKINTTPRITNIEETELKPLDKKVLKIGFEFITLYEDDMGEIKIGGDMLLMDDRHDIVLKHWENNKLLHPDVAVEVFNALFSKCLLKSSMIAEDIQLPLPLNLPRVRANLTEATIDNRTERKKGK